MMTMRSGISNGGEYDTKAERVDAAESDEVVR